MRRLFSWQLLSLLFVAMAAGALDNPNQSPQSPSNPPADSATPPGTSADTPPPATSTPSVTVTGKGSPLPKLAPDKFIDCYGIYKNTEPEVMDWAATEICQAELARDTRIVIDKCTNRDGQSAPAMAYYAQGDKPHALDDYNTAIKLAPKKAQPYFYRGVFYAQTDVAAAIRDFDTALSIDPKLVAALRQRAIIYLGQKNFSGALADFSEALRLRPKTAALWSERGYVSLLQRDYESALKDEGWQLQNSNRGLFRRAIFRG
jgi:tetratricopeptide (TPR) repeat protein